MSFGIQVAALAGVPPAVLAEARQKLKELEKKDAAKTPQFDIFSAPTAAIQENSKDPIRDAVDSIEPDTLTPRQALDVLYDLKQQLKRS